MDDELRRDLDRSRIAARLLRISRICLTNVAETTTSIAAGSQPSPTARAADVVGVVATGHR